MASRPSAVARSAALSGDTFVEGANRQHHGRGEQHNPERVVGETDEPITRGGRETPQRRQLNLRSRGFVGRGHQGAPNVRRNPLVDLHPERRRQQAQRGEPRIQPEAAREGPDVTTEADQPHHQADGDIDAAIVPEQCGDCRHDRRQAERERRRSRHREPKRRDPQREHQHLRIAVRSRGGQDRGRRRQQRHPPPSRQGERERKDQRMRNRNRAQCQPRFRQQRAAAKLLRPRRDGVAQGRPCPS